MSKILTTRQAAPPQVQQAGLDVEMAKANAIAKAGDLLPRTYRANPGAVLLAMDWADRVGLSVMDAIHGVAWVQGRPVIDATLLRALAIKAGYRVLVTEASRTSATAKVVLTTTGETLGSVTYSMEDAKTAGLAGKENWRKNPEDMLVARATSRAVRRYCSDALVGGGLTEDEVESLEVTAEVDQVQPAAVAEPEVIEDAVIVEEAAPEPKPVPTPPAAPQAAQEDAEPEKASPQLKGTAKAAVELCKGQGRYSELAEALKAADIPLSSQRWTKADCTQILAIVETIPPADTDLIEEN
jgi:hypothetical protein